MNQGGLKNVVTEPTRLENKRERRRVAGRAAALRRAPSDSDCSGETASLSADSGDRAVRLPPQPQRVGKNRGRRRGSEWEVLEGLKDGQRFEKRPDVFNGYLHKKRKWPLKGWHKRFFVVDGGILVYARSPTDVARGRLHGSVDVGLSVISAKARRRRIDIDADEFIYHLRAKTPDVFRTWLNVLKAHRLYRQHLLTFGARESVPKIHAPLDDLPATDNSSRTSQDSTESSSLSTSDDFPFPNPTEPSTNELCNDRFCFCQSTVCPPKDSQRPPKKSKVYDVKDMLTNYRSLCSMNCVARCTKDELKRRNSPNVSPGSTDAEKQIHSTDLDINSIRTIGTVKEDEVMVNKECVPVRYSPVSPDAKRPVFLDKIDPTTAFFFFSRKKSSVTGNSPMRKSKKSTNLVKYRNDLAEPTLKRPFSKCMLLGKYNMRVSRQAVTERSTDCSVACDPLELESNEVQVTIVDNKSLQEAMTPSDYDNITEKLLVSLFQDHKNIPTQEAEYYIKQVVKDLYDFKFEDVHPVKALFRSLLEYWLKNTSVKPVKAAMRQTQSIGRQSNQFFTKDQNLSSVYFSNITKQTQFHGISEMLVQYKQQQPFPKTSTRVLRGENKCPFMYHSPTLRTDSFEKDRRIQELEKLLKNTVYMCGTIRNNPSKQKDIKTTKALMHNIGKASQKSGIDKPADINNDNSNSSTENIQHTINHLISETSIPADVAKEFLGAYLDVLLKDESKSTNTSSLSSQHSIMSKISKEELSCEVQTEAGVKRTSKSITIVKPTELEEVKSVEAVKHIDPRQMYLKDILDKITTIFSKVKQLDDRNKKNDKSNENNISSVLKGKEQKDELGRPVKEYPGKNLIYENFDENSVVIDLTKFDLEHISMFSDPAIQGIMSITIKLKEKPATIAETKRPHLSLQFAESQRLKRETKKEYAVDDNWIKYIHPVDTKSNEIFQKKKNSKNPNNSFIDCPKQFDLKPYSSSSDATSKAYKVIHESEHSLDLSFNSSNSFRNESIIEQSFENKGTQSCYMMSFKKEVLSSKFQSRKKTKLKESGGILLPPKVTSPRRSPTRHTELSIFEKPAPRVIDEKFILLLLENLSLLSKNIPSLHKEINNLYTKLRKKHDKILKNCVNIQGLSLLGKIYNEESCGTSKKDAKTQCDVVPCPTAGTNKEISNNEKAVNTCSSAKIKDKENLKDANISAIDLTLLMNTEVQMSKPEELLMKRHCKAPSITDTSLMTDMAETGSVNSLGYTDDVQTVDNSTSNPNWLRQICTRECSMSTMLKCMIDTKKQIARLQSSLPAKEHVVTKKKPVKFVQDLNNALSLLSPAFKVSTQSQTDKKLLRFARERALDNDFNVYQLYISKKFNATRSNSLTESNLKINPSDEMKTLYRCTSSPSYCSG